MKNNRIILSILMIAFLLSFSLIEIKADGFNEYPVAEMGLKYLSNETISRPILEGDVLLRAVGCPYCSGALYPHDQGKKEISRDNYNCKHGYRHGEDIEITYDCYSVKICSKCLTKFSSAWTEREVTCRGYN